MERPPDAETDDHDWHNGHGEAPDSHSIHALQLAHRAVDKFPELKKRYQKYIGPVAVLSSAIVVLASIAVNRRLHRGQSPERILAEITTEEIEDVMRERAPKPAKKAGRIRRFLPRIGDQPSAVSNRHSASDIRSPSFAKTLCEPNYFRLHWQRGANRKDHGLRITLAEC